MGTKNVRRGLGALAVCVGLGGLLGGCMTYYQVTDNTNGKQYFAKESTMTREQGGELRFTDEEEGKTVTLTDYSRVEISAEEFCEAVEN